MDRVLLHWCCFPELWVLGGIWAGLVVGKTLSWLDISWWPSKQACEASGCWARQRNYKIRHLLPMECGFVPLREEDTRDCQGSLHLNSKPCSCAMGFLSLVSPSKEEVEGNFASRMCKRCPYQICKIVPPGFPFSGVILLLNGLLNRI